MTTIWAVILLIGTTISVIKTGHPLDIYLYLLLIPLAAQDNYDKNVTRPRIMKLAQSLSKHLTTHVDHDLEVIEMLNSAIEEAERQQAEQGSPEEPREPAEFPTYTDAQGHEHAEY